MEPVTHLLTGACLARTGFNRRAAYATVTMALAAEMPDIDTVWSWRGPVEGFAHHRGITHTFLALPFEAAALLLAVYCVHRWRVWRKRAAPKAPIAWGWLYVFALVGLLSHLLLDYTNNYGLRPFFPFNPRWFAGSFVFIFDPLIFVLLVAAFVVPLLFDLIGKEIGTKRETFRGRGWAVTALLGIVAWWGLRFVEHGKAVSLAMEQSIRAAEPVPAAEPEAEAEAEPAAATPEPAIPSQEQNVAPPEAAVPPLEQTAAPPEAAPVYLSAQRVLASPEPVNPFRWSVVTDFGPGYQLADVDTLSGNVKADAPLFPKAPQSAALLAAERSSLGRVYLDWSAMSWIDVNNGADGRTTVTFRDPRFMGGWMGEHRVSALTGVVRLDAQNRVVLQSLDGRRERQPPWPERQFPWTARVVTWVRSERSRGLAYVSGLRR